MSDVNLSEIPTLSTPSPSALTSTEVPELQTGRGAAVVQSNDITVFTKEGSITINSWYSKDTSNKNLLDANKKIPFRNTSEAFHRITTFNPFSLEFEDSINWFHPAFIKPSPTVRASHALLSGDICPSFVDPDPSLSALLKVRLHNLRGQFTYIRQEFYQSYEYVNSVDPSKLSLLGRKELRVEKHWAASFPLVEGISWHATLSALLHSSKVSSNCSWTSYSSYKDKFHNYNRRSCGVAGDGASGTRNGAVSRLLNIFQDEHTGDICLTYLVAFKLPNGALPTSTPGVSISHFWYPAPDPSGGLRPWFDDNRVPSYIFMGLFTKITEIHLWSLGIDLKTRTYKWDIPGYAEGSIPLTVLLGSGVGSSGLATLYGMPFRFNTDTTVLHFNFSFVPSAFGLRQSSNRTYIKNPDYPGQNDPQLELIRDIMRRTVNSYSNVLADKSVTQARKYVKDAICTSSIMDDIHAGILLKRTEDREAKVRLKNPATQREYLKLYSEPDFVEYLPN
jgi:hypothetical protein